MNNKIVIPIKTKKKKDTLVQTIRFSGELYDKLQDLAYKYNASFNLVVNEILLNVIDEIEIKEEGNDIEKTN